MWQGDVLCSVRGDVLHNVKGMCVMQSGHVAGTTCVGFGRKSVIFVLLCSIIDARTIKRDSLREAIYVQKLLQRTSNQCAHDNSSNWSSTKTSTIATENTIGYTIVESTPKLTGLAQTRIGNRTASELQGATPTFATPLLSSSGRSCVIFKIRFFFG